MPHDGPIRSIISVVQQLTNPKPKPAPPPVVVKVYVRKE